MSPARTSPTAKTPGPDGSHASPHRTSEHATEPLQRCIAFAGDDFGAGVQLDPRILLDPANEIASDTSNQITVQHRSKPRKITTGAATASTAATAVILALPSIKDAATRSPAPVATKEVTNGPEPFRSCPTLPVRNRSNEICLFFVDEAYLGFLS
jgi:hypothetical protein